jgi:signal transduction histidine kinase
LALDQRKAQGTQRYLGLRDIIGHIEILDEENDFQIISSREGIVRNDNFKSLTNQERNDSFFYKALRRLERYVVEGLNWDSSIFENKDPRFKEIEQKIIAGKTSEEELEYREDDDVKQMRIYSAIHSIISAKPIDVIELYINENLITQKIEEEKKKAEIEFEQLLDDFNNRKIDPDTLERILARKAEQNSELQRQINQFSKYSTTETTTLAVLELQNYQKTIQEQAKIIEELKEKLKQIENEKVEAVNEAKTFKDKAEKAETDLSIEKQKNYYLLATRRTLSPDADGLIHTIKINSIEIRDGIDNILSHIEHDNFTKETLAEKLGLIKINAERSLKVTEIATRSDFNEDIEKRHIDIVQYVKEYVELYGENFSDNLEFIVEDNNSHGIRNVSVLNLSIILDNLITNAVKWSATKILLIFKNLPDNKLSLIISDNGEGLVEKFLKNPDVIFDLSVRESAPQGFGGSGIGLYYTRTLLQEMNSSIEFVGNNQYLPGATFELKFG